MPPVFYLALNLMLSLQKLYKPSTGTVVSKQYIQTLLPIYLKLVIAYHILSIEYVIVTIGDIITKNASVSIRFI